MGGALLAAILMGERRHWYCTGEPFPEMKELDALPNVDELSKAIDSLARGKAPGSDIIPPEVIKAG